MIEKETNRRPQRRAIKSLTCVGMKSLLTGAIVIISYWQLTLPTVKSEDQAARHSPNLRRISSASSCGSQRVIWGTIVSINRRRDPGKPRSPASRISTIISVGIHQVWQRLQPLPLGLVVLVTEGLRIGSFSGCLDLNKTNECITDRNRIIWSRSILR